MPSLPTGTVTFLFTDIEGSTRLLQQLGEDKYAEVLADQRQLLRSAFQAYGGREVDSQGDASFYAFQRARDALEATIAAQRAIAVHAWPNRTAVRVRMGLHTGEPLSAEVGYAGMDVHRAARIGSAGHGGQILLSQATYGLIEEDLPDAVTLRDLGEHRLKDLSRPQRLYQLLVADLPSAFPPLQSLDALPNNLPVQLTSFVGREREKVEVERLLTTTRLLTLTGPGGAGKTRLALHVVAEVLEKFTDGVWLVELDSLSDPMLVSQALASTLSVREQSDRPMMATLAESLQLKHMLLVLDNCEHMIQACADLADGLLRTCPNLRILATSREGLGIGGELVYRVPSLRVPDLRDLPPLERLVENEAIQLFVERASLALPTFRLTEQNVSAVAQVCNRLDGIPLAIELAAVRVKALSVERIATRLDDRFRLLTGGSRAVLPRHQTLKAAMDWSYDLLSEEERVLFRRLSVFTGNFSLEATEEVCSGGEIDQHGVLDLLSNLVDKSLVAVEAQGGEVRYRLLETVHQYARVKLAEAGETATLQRQHQKFFIALASQAEPHLTGEEQAEWLSRLEVEHTNLRAALERSTDDPDSCEAAFRLTGALWWFWFVRGHWSETRKWLDWLEAALSERLTGSPAARAKAAYGAGLVAHRLGDSERAEVFCEASLTLCRDIDDKQGVAFSLFVLGTVALMRGDNERAPSLLEEGLAMFRDLNHRWGLARSLNSLGLIAQIQGDHERARRSFEESMTLSRALHDKWGLAKALNRLGELARIREDYREARASYDEALALCRELGDKAGIGAALHNLGYVELHGGDLSRAVELFRESLQLFHELGHRRVTAWCLVGLGGLACAQGHPIDAARLLSAADVILEEGPSLDPSEALEQAYYRRSVAAVRATLEDGAFTIAWAEGRAMTLGQAVGYALGEISRTAPNSQ